MKVLVTGSRRWTDADTIRRALRASRATTVIHGEAAGADRIARDLARELGIAERGYPADWTTFGKAAGPIRNQTMIAFEHTKADPIAMVLAFPLPDSKGTRDMTARAKAAGIRVVVY